ncbi:MAG: rhomboid family protein [Verrucomicrobia bacterium]|nr:rhomboid family protein [Verrucomicrobiota bacterium]
MIAPAPFADGTLRARRCVRHGDREAAARCPECGRFFCRECVVEHDGKILCADCLARSAVASRAAHRGRGIRRSLGLAAAVMFTWLIFYGAGLLLLRIPASFHEGTVWQTEAPAP